MPKILYIDDDKTILDMYRFFFSISPRKDTYQFLTADSISEGRDLAKKEKPDVILLDLILPKIENPRNSDDVVREGLNKEFGFNLLKELKDTDETKSIPVLILSNLSEQRDKDRAKELGAADYFVKSHVVPSEVLNTIDHITSKPAA